MTPDWLARDARAPAPPLGPDAVHLWLLDGAARAHGVDALLAAYAAEPGAMTRGAHGKPRLPDGTLRFNLAHSGDRLLVAIGHGAELGVDLEQVRAVRRRDALLARCFTPREQAAIRAAADPDDALLAAWTAKEALVKAIGRGIAYGLRKVELDLDGAVPRLAVLDGPAAPAAAWSLVALAPEPGWRAALAVHGPLGPVFGFRSVGTV